MLITKEIGSGDFQVRSWVKINLAKGEAGLELKKKAGKPRDNAVMESFCGRFKDTLRKRFRYRESNDLPAVIEQAIITSTTNALFVS